MLTQLVDFEALRKGDGARLFVSATNVNTGKIRVFERKELTLDMLLASAALPTVFQAVQIDGEAYWDGGFMGNPAIFPLIYNCTARDVVIVQVEPLRREGVRGQCAGASPLREHRVPRHRSCARCRRSPSSSSCWTSCPAISVVRGLKRMHIHLIEDEPAMESLGVASKLNTDMDFLLYLKRLGRETAERWLKENFDALGQRSTVDIRHEISVSAVRGGARKHGASPG